MTGLSSAAKRLKKLAAEIPDDWVVRSCMQALEAADNAFADHAIALIGASVVGKALEVAIRSRFIDLTKEEYNRLFTYENNGPLADLSARIKIAQALGVFGSQTKRDLEHIRTIRNAFAHAAHLISFDTPEISEICNLFHTPKTITLLGGVGGDTPRGRYIDTTVTLAERLKKAIEKPTANSLYEIFSKHLKQRLLP